MNENQNEEGARNFAEVPLEEIRERIKNTADINSLIAFIKTIDVLPSETDPNNEYQGKELAKDLNDAKVQKILIRSEAKAIEYLLKVTRSYGIRNKAAELLGIDISKL